MPKLPMIDPGEDDLLDHLLKVIQSTPPGPHAPAAAVKVWEAKYSPSQSRDAQGRFGSGASQGPLVAHGDAKSINRFKSALAKAVGSGAKWAPFPTPDGEVTGFVSPDGQTLDLGHTSTHMEALWNAADVLSGGHGSHGHDPAQESFDAGFMRIRLIKDSALNVEYSRLTPDTKAALIGFLSKAGPRVGVRADVRSYDTKRGRTSYRNLDREDLERELGIGSVKSSTAAKYSPDQPRDDHGRFGSGSSGSTLDTRRTAVVGAKPADATGAKPARTREPSTHKVTVPTVQPGEGPEVTSHLDVITEMASERQAEMFNKAKDRAFEDINSIMRDGEMQSTRFICASMEYGNNGSYSPSDNRSVPTIRIDPEQPGAVAAMIHETGHMIADLGFGDVQAQGEEFQEWRDAVHQTETYKSILDARVYAETGVADSHHSSTRPLVKMSIGATHYLMMPAELWARSFAQWVATRSGDKRALRSMESVKFDKKFQIQWNDDEFEPVGKAIDSMFRKKGWIK